MGWKALEHISLKRKPGTESRKHGDTKVEDTKAKGRPLKERFPKPRGMKEGKSRRRARGGGIKKDSRKGQDAQNCSRGGREIRRESPRRGYTSSTGGEGARRCGGEDRSS